MIYQILFSKFSDALTPFTCVSAINNLRSICLGVNFLSPSPFYSLLKSRTFSTIWIAL